MKNFIFIIFSIFFLFACDEEIGDSCSVNSDCSTSGDRICDTASPGGYCTIEGCTASSCPSGSRCIAFFPVESLIYTCQPETEDLLGSETATDDCTQDEICLQNGFCAPKIYEKRYCMKKCSGNGDCRSNYECRTSGIHGSQKVPGEDENIYNTGTTKFCAPGDLP